MFSLPHYSVDFVLCCTVGVYGFPHCSGDTYTICDYVRKMLTMGAYVE